MLWEAFASEDPAVLLIDEIDKSGYRVSQRSPARARPHGIPRLRDPGDDRRPAPPGGDSSRPTTRRSCPTRSSGAASSLHPLSRAGHHGTHRRGPFSGPSRRRSSRRRWSASFSIRSVNGLKKKPSTSELLDWIKLLLAEDLAPEDLREDSSKAIPRLHGALLKNEQDVQMFERLAFLSRRQN